MALPLAGATHDKGRTSTTSDHFMGSDEEPEEALMLRAKAIIEKFEADSAAFIRSWLVPTTYV